MPSLLASMTRGPTVAGYGNESDSIQMNASDNALESTGKKVLSATICGITGNLAAMLGQAVLIPMYLSCLGATEYGFIAFASTVQSTTRALDFGLSACAARDLAISRSANSQDSQPRIIATYETLTVIIALIALLGATLAMLGSGIAKTLVPTTIHHRLSPSLALLLVLLQAAASYLAGFYSNCLVGLDRQRLIAAIKMAESLSTGLATLAALTIFDADLGVILALNTILSATACCLYRIALSRSSGTLLIPSHLDITRIRENMGFALGAWWINTIAILLIHADRFVLLRYLDLATYGKYCIASTVVAAAYGLVFPALYNALLPRLARPRLSTSESVGDVYRFAVQSSSAISALAYISWLLLANALISTWTGSATLGSEIAPVAIVLALGHSINALMLPAHALFMATGNSRPPAIASTILGIAFVPLLICLCANYGALGSAVAFLAMNLIYLVLGMCFLRSLLRRAEIAKVVLQDMAPVAVLVIVAHFLVRHFGFPHGSGMHLIVPYLATCTISMTAILILLPSFRRRLVEYCVE